MRVILSKPVYSIRPIFRPLILLNINVIILKSWASEVDLTLESLISIKEDRLKVLTLLYHYRYLNSTNLMNLLYTNLITHRVRISFNIKSIFNIFQKRWLAYIE